MCHTRKPTVSCYCSGDTHVYVPGWIQVRDMEDGSAVWIAKPSITNQAKGICIFDRCSDLRTALENSEDLREWVVQRWHPLYLS
jgi:hypothetical protein